MNNNLPSLREILASWIAGVNAGDLLGVGALYRKGAVLMPTFSQRILSSPQEIADYFEKLTPGRSVKVVLREETVVTQDEEGPLKVISGIYDWYVEEDGQEKSIAARFSVAMVAGDPAPIVNHHSSVLPVE